MFFFATSKAEANCKWTVCCHATLSYVSSEYTFINALFFYIYNFFPEDARLCWLEVI